MELVYGMQKFSNNSAELLQCLKIHGGSADWMLRLQATYPAFSTPDTGGVLVRMEGVTEVHLRRLDGPGVLHRRAVAVIKINASTSEVRANANLPGSGQPCQVSKQGSAWSAVHEARLHQQLPSWAQHFESI